LTPVTIKVVIRLPVNRLPVKLLVTSFNFQLPVTDLPTYFLPVMQISASASSHTLAQANKDRPTLDPAPDIPALSTARSHWFMFTQYLTVKSAPPLLALGGRSRERREGRGENSTAGVDDIHLGLK